MPQRHDALWLRIRVSFEQDADSRHRDQSGRAMARPPQSARNYLVGCDGGASTVRKQLGIKLRGEGNLLQLRQALYYAATICYDKLPIGPGPDRAVTITWPTTTASFLIMQDFDQALDACMRLSRATRTMKTAVRKDRRRAGRLRNALCRPVAAEPAARRQISARTACSWPATPSIWSFPPAGSGMNTGVGDAIDLGWKLAATLAGLGRSEPAWLPMRSSGGRSATAMSALRVTLRSGRRKWRSDVAARHRRDDTAGGQATRDDLAARRRCRAAQEQ